MVYYETEGGRIEHPSNASEFTIEQHCDIRLHLSKYNEAVKEELNLNAVDHLLAALRICVTGNIDAIPLMAGEGELSLNRLLEGVAEAIVTMPEAQDLDVLEWEAPNGVVFTLDKPHFEKLGGTLEQFVEYNILEACMPTEPFSNSDTSNKFYGLTLKQCAILFRSDAMPLPFTGTPEARDKWLEEVAPMLKDMPAHLAQAAKSVAANFIQAYCKLIGKNSQSSNSSSTGRASRQATGKQKKRSTTATVPQLVA